jgi:capsular exopolysaccharide synthesis family protein
LGEISEALRRAREGARRDPATAAAPAVPAARREVAPVLSAPLRDLGAAIAIPDTQDGPWGARAVLVEPRGEVAEGYRHFAIRLQRVARERGARSVLVTSAARGEGKTTTSCNLALALASISSGRRVALLELDVRRPTAASQLGISPRIGIERVLEGNASLAEACSHTQLPELDLYLATAPCANPLAAISATSTGMLLRDLARQYDLVVIDSPPVLPVPDVPILLPHADAVLLVARNGVSRRAALREAVEAIGTEKLVGVFLNEGRTPRHRRYYGYYGYGADAPTARPEGGEGNAS